MASVYLTRRALRDIDEIEHYSARRWGQQAAEDYLQGLNAALQRLQDCPALLRERPEHSLRLRFYPVLKHILIADLVGERIYILTVWHGSMDLPGRLAELEPQLVFESELLHAQIAAGS